MRLWTSWEPSYDHMCSLLYSAVLYYETDFLFKPLTSVKRGERREYVGSDTTRTGSQRPTGSQRRAPPKVVESNLQETTLVTGRRLRPLAAPLLRMRV